MTLSHEEKEEWYTGAEATHRLSENSGRRIRPDYVRQLARLELVETWKIGKRMTLYRRRDIDNRVVEGQRGRKKRGW